MFLDSFHAINADKKFQHLTESLMKDYGVDMSVYIDLSEKELKLFADDLIEKKNAIIMESDFNSYFNDPEYVRTSLLLEAIRIVLREICPKRLSQKKKQTEEKVDETLNYKIHLPTSVAVDHDLEEDKERPDLYWRRHQWEAEKDQKNHPVSVMDASPAGEAYSTPEPVTDEKVQPYAQNVVPDPTRTKEDDPNAGIYVAVMDPNRFLGDKETKIMAISPMVTSGNEESLMTRKIMPVMVDSVERENELFSEDKEEMKEKQEGLVEGLGVLVESELERAEIVLATKELVGRLQKMIEDLGKMGTDDIMPLVDGLRNYFSPQIAEMFSQQAEQQIQNAADAIQNFKDVIDGESQKLEGRISDEDANQPVNDMTTAPELGGLGTDMEVGLGEPELGGAELGGEEELGDLLGGDEANASEEPLGRARKEGRVITIAGRKVKLSEEQVNALTQAVQIRKKIAALVEAATPKTAVIVVEGRNIRLSEFQIKSLLFAKNFNKLVEAKQARTARLSEDQARMLYIAKQLTEKIRELVGENPKNISLMDIVGN